MKSEKVVRVAIVEDDATELKSLCATIDVYSIKHDISFNKDCYGSAKEFLEDFSAEYDVIFMDIQLPDMDGMTAAHKLREKDKDVLLVFVTNFAQYAINGYEVGASDFIVKPVDYDWFEPKMEKLLSRISNISDIVLTVKMSDGLVTVHTSQLKYIEVTGHWLVFHTTTANFRAYGSLSKLEPQLARAKFVRCNNCFLVNPAFVQAIGSDSTVVGGDELKISRGKSKEFKQAMAFFLGGGGV